jgi:hypothetical protein
MSDWSLFKNRTVCINLEERKDRRTAMNNEFKKVGLDGIVKFHTVKRHPVSGTTGCQTSHIEVLREARDSGLDWLLILEDDLEFDEERLLKSHQIMCDFLSKNTGTKDWDLLFLGMVPMGGLGKDGIVETHNDTHIYRVVASCTHAYVANLHSEKMLAVLEKPIVEKSTIYKSFNLHHIDHRYMVELPVLLGVYPMIVFQRDELGTDNPWGLGEFTRPSRQIILNNEQCAVYTKSALFTSPSLLMQLYIAQSALYKIPGIIPIATKLSNWWSQSVPKLSESTKF